MSSANQQSLAQPEPELTSAQLIERARALRPLLFEQQEESDARGSYSERVQRRLLDEGFYRILQPKKFGGYEFDLKTFIRVVLELSHGHPGAGWCFSLAASHAYVLACHWPLEAQAALFGPSGDFRSSMVLAAGTLKPVDGGYIVSGTWPFASGTPVCNYFMGNAMLMRPGEPPQTALFAIPKEQIDVMPDWGGDLAMGMQASGSNTVRIKDAFIPALNVVIKPLENVMMASEPAGAPGARLYGNPMYLGILQGWFACEFGAILTGAARAAIDEYERILKSKPMTFNPQRTRMHDPNQQRALGEAMNLADSAELLTFAVVDHLSGLHQRWAKHQTPITHEDTLRVAGVARQACRMACDAVELLFQTAGASVAKRGERLQRYFRDVQMFRVHIQSSPRWPIMRAATELGIPPQPGLGSG